MKVIVRKKYRHNGENLAVYEALRNSIVSCEERIQNISINMYIVYFAMFSFGFTFNWLFPASCMMLISFQAMINIDRRSIEKVSAYIRVFFEEQRKDIHWESLHKDAEHLLAYNNEVRNIGWYFDRYGSSILASFSLISLLFSILSNQKLTTSPVESITQIAVTFCFVVLVVCINRKLFRNTGIQEDGITKSIRVFYQKAFPLGEVKDKILQ